jgi:hypothetical protein
MKSLNVTLLIFALIIFSCKKDNVNPANASNNNNNNNNSSTSLGQWIKQQSYKQYAADGVTVTYDAETTYDSQGRVSGLTVYSNGVMSQQNTNYSYNGTTCTFTSNIYSNGALYSSTKTEITYYNN